MLMVEFPEVRDKGYVLGIAVSLMQSKTDVAIELVLYLGRNPFLPMSYLRTGSDSMGAAFRNLSCMGSIHYCIP